MERHASFASTARVPVLDVARGVALLAMVVYHLTWDLGFFGFIGLRAGVDPSWRLFAKAIAASFLVLVGIGLVLASRGGLRAGPYLQRLGLITLGALAVTAATFWLMPEGFVFFGILHCIALSSVLALCWLRAPAWVTAASAGIVWWIPSAYQGHAFDGWPWWWLGLSQTVPLTNDYVPLLPWFGFVLAGVSAARLAVDRGVDEAMAGWTPLGGAGRALALCGRHSLAIYLLHQPVLFGLLALAAAIAGPRGRADPGAAFLPACTRSCAENGGAQAVCLAACTCMKDALAAKPDLVRRSMSAPLSPEDEATLRDAARSCSPATPQAGAAP